MRAAVSALLAAIVVASVIASSLVAPGLRRADAAGLCDPPVNPVACENTLPGNPAGEWDVTGQGPGSETIEGFATDISVDRGETVRFKVDTDATDYRIEIYRLGYYQGNGARRVATVQPSAPLPQPQPACAMDSTVGLVDCGGWAESASWPVPADAVSGVYIGKLVREDDVGGDSHMVFVVRDDDGQSDLLFQTADTTWQAYNSYGGASLYTGGLAGRAYKVSYNRPFRTRQPYPLGSTESWLFNAEYPMIRWLEANGYDVSYSTGVDTDRRGGELLEHKAFLSVGHDEYWSAAQRANVEAARDAGVHLAFFSGNEVFWKTRWETSIDGAGTPHRTLVSYKETAANAKIDPDAAWTGTWRDPRFSPPADGGRPENALTGTMFMVNGRRADSIEVPAAEGKLRFWRGTSVAQLAPGAVATMPEGTLGYEWDEDPDNGFRPPGAFGVSSTTVDVSGQYLQDHGVTYGPGVATHRLMLHRAASGAWVFGAGAVQWSWGLDEQHDFAGPPSDPAMRQATVNLLADMGAQPATLQPGLTPAAPSSDAAAPTATVSSPVAGATVALGTPTTISGAASDVGGRVAGVEVSVDDGASWRRALGREAWTFSWTPTAVGAAAIRVRAVDDNGNLASASAAVEVTVGGGPSCPCSIWGPSEQPGTASAPDTQAVELGVRFRSAVSGYVSGLRFYKGPANTGVHVGSLWTSSGGLLARATFSGESASGWQEVSFAAPTPISAGVTYVASYFAPNGGYARDQGAFSAAGVENGPLSALANGVDGLNGVYRYGPDGGFPTGSFQATNYWVDVVFTLTNEDQIAPAVLSVAPAANAAGVALASDVTATFTEAVQPGSASIELRTGGAPVAGTTSYDPVTHALTFNPAADLSSATVYTVTVSGAVDLAGNPMSAPFGWSFSTIDVCPCSIWPSTATPAVASAPDALGVELGVRFRADQSGFITGVRFYKGPANTGAHVGSLWTSTGVLLSRAVFTNESATGWQHVLFGAPVAVSAGETYVASYHAPNGGYAKDRFYFENNTVVAPPLRALANGLDGPNGVYAYGLSPQFPVNTFESTNYWVDVTYSVLASDAVAPSVLSTTPAAGSSTLALDGNISAVFTEPIQPATATFELRTASGSLVPSALTYDAGSQSLVLDPAQPLARSSLYTATVSGARDAAGNPMAGPHSWTFSTVDLCPCSIWDDQTTPATVTVSDAAGVELGVRFRADRDGFITGLRFYKGPANTGTHVGSLWTNAGVLLSRATFVGETATGWQQVLLPAPVAVSANTTYVASYFAPNGGYSKGTRFFFEAAVANPPVRALANGADGPNGVYSYGTSPGFPTSTFESANYYVDVVFALTADDHVGPGVTGTSPAPGATGVDQNASVTASFNEAIQPATLVFELRGPGGALTPANVTYDGASRTATLDPTAAMATGAVYTATVSGARDAAGNPMAAPVTWSFATVDLCPCTIWASTATPGLDAAPDTAAVEVGVRFRASQNGLIRGVRFYKGAGNTGVHVGNLWTNAGVLLGQATFTNETASGWQEVTFASPVPITAGVTYVASYFAPNGRYARDQNFFRGVSVVREPLEALANGVDGANGVYRYGAASAFPTSTFRSTNYWVDVVFTPS